MFIINVSKYKIYFIFFRRINNEINNHKYNVIKEVRELFNELRSNISCEEINRIRKELYKKEAIYNFLKEKDGLTDKERTVFIRIF